MEKNNPNRAYLIAPIPLIAILALGWGVLIIVLPISILLALGADAATGNRFVWPALVILWKKFKNGLIWIILKIRTKLKRKPTAIVKTKNGATFNYEDKINEILKN
jgi:membrane protease YdiL (CAAX protease family)